MHPLSMSAKACERMRSAGGADGLDVDLLDEWFVAGHLCVTRISGAESGQFCGVEQWAQGVEPPAGDDDIVRGKQEREPFRRRISAAFERGLGSSW